VSEEHLSRPLQILLALGLSALAAGAGALVQHFAQETPYFIFLPAVIVSSWYGGRAAGLVATMTSLGFIDYYARDASFFVSRNWRSALLLGLFALVSVAVTLLTAGRRRAEAEREAALREAEQARQDAEQANRLKDQFVANISHELRTPLNAVLGWASVLVSGRVEPEKVPAAIASIQRNAQAQKQLVDDLLDTSAIMSGRLRLAPDVIDLADVARSAVDAVRLSIEAKRQCLDQRLESVETVGDATRLRQVVWNLLMNAVKFTPEGGTIQLRVEGHAQEARITVRDNGRGIGADFLPHAFDPFRQADSSITRVSGGLGLGLALVRHLVEAHGGRVWVESDGPGRGATFTVCLPIGHLTRRATDVPPGSEPCEPPEGATEPKTDAPGAMPAAPGGQVFT